MTFIAVLVKDFESAKQRLSPALEPVERRELAIRNARRALRAARSAGAATRVVAVCGSEQAAALAREEGAEVVLEREPAGQNPAASAAIAYALEQGADELLLVSSDLPLITPESIELVIQAAGTASPAAVAAAATGRGGTNALFMRPPGAIGLFFGDESLPKFEADAFSRGVGFAIVEPPELALDLDEPSDLEALART